MDQVQVGDMSHSNIRYIKPGYFSVYPNLRFLNLSNNNLGESDFGLDGICIGCKNLLHLDVSANNLRNINKHFLTGCTSIIRLQLQQNNFASLSLSLSNFTTLRHISFAHNKLSRLEPRLMVDLNFLQHDLNPLNLDEKYTALLEYTKGKLSVDIRNNLFVCSCPNLDFLKWVKSTPVILVDRDTLTCKDDNNILRNVVELKPSEICPYDPVAMLIVVCVFAVIVILFGIVLYRFRWFFKWHLHKVRLRCHDRKDELNFIYDAFILYEEETDYKWMKNKLLPRAEGEWGFRLLVGQRDWLVGVPIAECIVESIQYSRKVVWVITRNFVGSKWCDEGLHFTLVDKDRCDVIVLLMEDVSGCPKLTKTLLSILKERTYIEWTDNEDGRNLFWAQLRRDLKHDR